MCNASEIRRNFGNRATNYRYSAVHNNSRDLERMLQLLRPAVTDTVLDVATGAGHTAIALAECVKRVVAVDITSEMLEEAQDAAMQKGLSNIEFRVEDVHELSMSDEQFDIVASRFAVHHFHDVRIALQEMCRVLKPGGRLYVLDCSVVDGDEAEKQMNNIELLRDSSHVFSYSPRLWKRMLQDLPLEIEHMDFLKDEYHLPEWFDRMGTDGGKREEVFRVLENLSESCKNQYAYSDDHITTYRVEILGKKV